MKQSRQNASCSRGARGRGVGLVFAILGLLYPGTVLALTVTGDLSTGLTANDLVASLLGPGVSVSNVSYTGAPVGGGAFTGGTAPIGFESGVILGSGNATNVLPPNNNDFLTAAFALPGDADLDLLIPGYLTQDATVLEFDFIPAGSVLTFRYVFASEEYNEYANTAFNDVFGFFVNGVNRALLPDGITVVSINNVNAGNIGGSGSPVPVNPTFYRNNDCSDLPCPNIDTQADGLTVVLALTADVNPGVPNHMKLAIADAGDQALDSWVFIQGGSLTVAEICTNQIDDDGDQLIDYADPDCQVCGNTHLDPNEECDDGNLIDCDGCNANCTTPRCGDGVVCAPEACDPASQSGTCGPGEICSGSCTCSCTQDSDCNDGDTCNGTELCAGANGCQRGTPLVCDDSDPCNGVETCNPESGCVPASSPCDDLNPCNGAEGCTNVEGSPQCSEGTPPSPLPPECGGCCEAYYPSASSAVGPQSRPPIVSASVGGCVAPVDQVYCFGQYFPGATCGIEGFCQTSTCGNGIVETGEDCDEGGSGLDACCNGTTCLYEPSGTSCADDEDVCTNDECNAVGECTHPNNTAPCDDGDQCTDPDICSNGTCGGTPVVPPACDDSNGCTDDGCYLNQCTNVPNSATCDDGDQCTGSDACSNGACGGTPVVPPACDDSNGCTDDGCYLNQCTNMPNSNPCDDGDLCTNADTCSNGECGGRAVVPEGCDDSNPCTDDGCSLNQCTHANNSAECNDGDLCTNPDVCSNGACGGAPVVPPACDDSNGCTDDGCYLNQCTNVPNSASCEDGAFCTDGDMCSGGSCQPGAPRDCGVGIVCNLVSCDEATDQCVTIPDPGLEGQLCDDSNACTNGTTCSLGVCGGGTLLDCNDSNTCTADSCDPILACLNPIIVESRACASCEDGIDNDSVGGTDYEDCSCNLLCESFDYAVIGTRTTSRRTVYMGSDTHVSSVAVTGGAGFNSRASVCAERELALIAATTIDGAAAARQNAIFGTGMEMSLGFFAADVPPGVLTTTGVAPMVGPAGLTLTDPANLFPLGYVDLSGTHEEYTDCGLAIQSLEGDRDALLALTPTANLGAVTHGIGDPAIVVSGPGPHVLHMTRLRVRGQAVLEIDGDADSVVIVQIDRSFSVAQRAGVAVGGGLKPSKLIWALDRSGRAYIGSDTEEEPDDADAVFAGTVLAPERKIVVGKRSRIAGALLGRKVQLNGGVVVSHHPFTGVGP